MKTAQIAWSILTGLLVVLAVVLFITDGSTGSEAGRTVAAWVCLTLGLIGYLALVGMIITDYRRSGADRTPASPG